MASDPPFQIVASEVVRRQLQRCGRTAARFGQLADFNKSLKFIYSGLEKTPTSFGDPISRAHQMSMTEYRVIRGPIRVVYTVHDSKPIVFVKQFSYFPEYGKGEQ